MTRRLLVLRRTLPCFQLFFAILVCGHVEAFANPNSIETPQVGWGGYYVVGRWAHVVVPLNVDEPSSVEMELISVDSDGNRVGFVSPRVGLHRGKQTLNGMIKVGRLDGEVSVRIDGFNEIHATPGHGWLREPLKPSSRIVVTVGDPQGFNFESGRRKQDASAIVVAAKSAELPIDPLAYDSVFSLVIAGAVEISPQQANAIREWVAAGGRLVLSLPLDATSAIRSVQPFVDWLPVGIGEQPAVVREFAALETFAGKSIRVPQNVPLSIPSLKLDAGEVLAATRTDPLLVRAPYGMGSVTVLAMDLTTTPLSEWQTLIPFCERLSGVVSNQDSREKVLVKGSQLSSNGISDLATQLHGYQEHFSLISRSSPWFVIGLLVAFLGVVGPLDYVIVHQVLKRPHLTWVSFPLLVTACGFLAWSWGATSNGSSRHANELDIVNIDVATATARGRHFVTLYSPATSQSTVAVQVKPLTNASETSPTSRIIWHGVPESTFGGMLRETGIEQGAKYQQTAEGILKELPVMQWSTKSLVAESVQSAKGLIECDLRSSATGRLSGTIIHRFSGTIEDWMVVYKNVVYRYLSKKDDPNSLPFPPEQLWRVEQPSVYSRELRPYLTGMVTMAKPKFGQSNSVDITHHLTNYDPMSIDPAYILRMMTFHEDIGGERYTGLTNLILDDEDFSQLHRLGRAILFGRLSQPVGSFQQDEATIEPDRQVTFLRLILPVSRPTETIKDLRRVVPE